MMNPSGQREIFEALVRRHRASLERLALRLTGNQDDAADLLQESLLDAYRGFHRFEQGSYFSGWLGRIMSNNHFDRLRRRRLVTLSMEGWEDTGSAPQFPDPAPDPASRMAAEELPAEISAALSALPAAQRETVALCDLEGATYEEAARAAECPIGTIRSRLHRAHQALRRALSAAAAPEPAAAGGSSSRRAFLRFGAAAAAASAGGPARGEAAPQALAVGLSGDEARPLLDLLRREGYTVRMAGCLAEAGDAAPDLLCLGACRPGPGEVSAASRFEQQIRAGRTSLLLFPGSEYSPLLRALDLAPALPAPDAAESALIEITAPRHPIAAGLEPFTLEPEGRSPLASPQPPAQIPAAAEWTASPAAPDILILTAAAPHGGSRPALVAHHAGRGRILRLALTPARAAASAPALRALTNAIRWASPAEPAG